MPELLRVSISKQPPQVHLVSSEFSPVEIGIVRQLVGHTIAEVEGELIRSTLIDRHGSRTRAAKLLDISVRALRNKIREYKACGITVAEPSQSGHLSVD